MKKTENIYNEYLDNLPEDAQATPIRIQYKERLTDEILLGRAFARYFCLACAKFDNQQSNQPAYYCTTDADCESYWGY